MGWPLGALMGMVSLALLLGLVACGPQRVKHGIVKHGIVKHGVVASQSWQVSSLAVYPFTVRFSQTPSLSYEKTVDLVTEAVATQRFQVYSYGDFQLFTVDDAGVYEGRTLLSVIRDDKIDIGKFAIMKGGVELLGAEGNAPQGRADAVRAQAAQKGSLPVRVWVEVSHYKEQVVLFRAEQQLLLEPVRATETDPFPQLTLAVRTLAREALKGLISRVQVAPPSPPLPFQFYADHSLLFRIATDDVPSIARHMSSNDEVENTIQLLQGYQYFYPAITTLEVERLQLSPGLLITRIDAPWVQEQGLEPGDILVRVQGQPVVAAHQLARHARLLVPGGTLVLSVIRKGKPVDVTLARPAPIK